MTAKDYKNKKIKELYYKAKGDYISAKNDLASSEEDLGFVLWTIGFHCQQCVEKCLKVFMILNDVGYERKHDIFYLLDQLKDINDKFEFVREVANILNDFAVRARYSGSVDENFEEIQIIFKIAEQTLKIIEEEIDKFK